MHDKFIVRDGASVWTGSGNFTRGGLLLQDNNYLTIHSPATAGIDKRFVAANSHAFVKSDNNNFMHNKVMIIDDNVVITGSYNFSENAELNDENILIIESAAAAASYTKYFDTLFQVYQKTGPKLPLP